MKMRGGLIAHSFCMLQSTIGKECLFSCFMMMNVADYHELKEFNHFICRSEIKLGIEYF